MITGSDNRGKMKKPRNLRPFRAGAKELNASIVLASVTHCIIAQYNFNDMKDSSGSSQQTLSTFYIPGTVGIMMSQMETVLLVFSPGH